MKIPKEFYIKGKLWTVEYKWRLEEPGIGKCDGLCDFTLRVIYLDRLISKEDKVRVFLHEYTHALIHEAHLHEAGGIDGILEEVLCESVADGILENFILKWKRK
ncbi:hypothetical protein D3C87_125100 [compost metagenome]